MNMKRGKCAAAELKGRYKKLGVSIKKRYKESLPEAPSPTKPVRIDDRVSTSIIRQVDYKRGAENSRRHAHGAWSTEEEELLKSKAREGYDWRVIAEYLPGRTLTAVEMKYRKLQKRGEI